MSNIVLGNSFFLCNVILDDVSSAHGSSNLDEIQVFTLGKSFAIKSISSSGHHVSNRSFGGHNLAIPNLKDEKRSG
jgi:hypothetical protein